MQTSSILLAFTAALCGGSHPANARMLRFPTQFQHLSKELPVPAQQLEGQQTVGYPSVEASGINVVFYVVLGCLGTMLSMLLLSCLYDTAKHWSHRSHFRACKKKVQRVHEVLERSSGELPLCPYCVEFISSKASRSAVVFHCGHRFHIDCANRWLREQGSATGPGDTACPLCQSCATSDLGGPVEDALQVASKDSDGTVLGQPDEFKAFVLRSLSEMYPTIIREDCVRRWCHCHTELWMSELRSPKYNSIFQTKQMT